MVASRFSTPMDSSNLHSNSSSPERRDVSRDDGERRIHYDAVFTLARASEAHDPETGAHLLRIREIVERIALQMNYKPEEAATLAIDAMLHDVGKLNIPREVLQKEGPLTPEERELMESHTLRGEELLADRPSFHRAAIIARSHHEAWEGGGYPDGLSGDAIPLEARITAVADVLDALISDRCYKQAWSYEDAMTEVCGLSEKQLDPAVIEALHRCNAAGGLCAIFDLPPQCVTLDSSAAPDDLLPKNE